jgi:enoyl-CoA hydratase/carnithine racemase
MSLKLETTRYEIEDRIATITIDRPEQLNAFSVPAMREMLAAFDEADRDDGVRAVIITGAGKAFCAGADLSRGPQAFDYASYKSVRDELIEHGIYRDSGGFMSLRLFKMNKPVVAAINGPAAGVGATMPLACDIRLASAKARFIYPFVRRGIVPESCSSWYLPRIVGISTALEWTLTGRQVGAEEALARGLVRSVHAPDELMPAARSIAREIADNAAPQAVALARQMMWRMMGADHPMAAHRVDSRGVQALGKTPDVYEGVAAFLEKREPVFAGSVAQGLPDIFPDWDEPDFR